MNLINPYKQKVASRYLPMNPDEMLNKIMESEYYFASVKYDGHFGMLEIKNGKGTLYSSDGTSITISGILDAAQNIKKDVLLAGEICCFSNGQSQTNMQVTAALDEPDKHDIRFGIFDLIEYEGNAFIGDLKEKNKIIEQLAVTDKIFCIKQELYESRKDVAAFYTETIKDADTATRSTTTNGSDDSI